MNIPIEIPSSISIMSIGAVIGFWFHYQNKIDKLDDKVIEVMRQIVAMWKWKDSHDKEWFDIREKISRDISRLEGQNMVVNEQFKQIMVTLTDIKNKLGS